MSFQFTETLKVLLPHLIQIWTWGHCNTLIVFFFIHSVADLMVCFSSLSCYMTCYVGQDLAVRHITSLLPLEYREVHLSDCKVIRSCSYKINPVISPLPLYTTVDLRCLC